MLNTIAWYIPLLLTLSLLIVTWRFGDWRGWRKFYSTILFVNIVSLFAYVLTYEYPLWFYHESFMLSNRMMHEFRLIFFLFPAIIILFFTFYPHTSRRPLQLAYILLWGILWSILEILYMTSEILTYHNGWKFWWSVVVWIIMFSVITIHQRKPMWAWLICVSFSVFVINYFNIPFGK